MLPTGNATPPRPVHHTRNGVGAEGARTRCAACGAVRRRPSPGTPCAKCESTRADLPLVQIYLSYARAADRGIATAFIRETAHAEAPYVVSGSTPPRPNRRGAGSTRAAIAAADVVVVLLGPRTAESPEVTQAVAFANVLGKVRLLLIGYPNGRWDWRVEGGGGVFRWDPAGMDALLSPDHLDLCRRIGEAKEHGTARRTRAESRNAARRRGDAPRR